MPYNSASPAVEREAMLLDDILPENPQNELRLDDILEVNQNNIDIVNPMCKVTYTQSSVKNTNAVISIYDTDANVVRKPHYDDADCDGPSWPTAVLTADPVVDLEHSGDEVMSCGI